jgi:hypothetical protein
MQWDWRRVGAQPFHHFLGGLEMKLPEMSLPQAKMRQFVPKVSVRHMSVRPSAVRPSGGIACELCKLLPSPAKEICLSLC